MNFFESFKQAFDSLRANKLRSILTMIGIIMGVFSVITIMALGNAFSSYVEAQFEKLGANVITVTYKNNSGDVESYLTMDDVKTIKKVAPELKNITTALSWNGSVRVGTKNRDANLTGVSSQYENFSPMEIAFGRFINDLDVSAKSNVVVVDEYFAKRYFSRSNIVGEVIDFDDGNQDKLKLKVVGVTKGEDGLIGSFYESDEFPTQIMVPITTAQALYGSDYLNNIMITVVEKDRLKEIGDKIVKALEFKRNRSGLFVTRNSVEQQKMFMDTMSKISMFLLVIAVITLVVGGIGIVNILLVSVTERIREIGIRKALGARGSDIIIQFITESIIMTGLSGLIGILIGVIAGGIISAVIKIPPVVDLKVI
ncbi:MAG: ABC transporter permease, partial [Bacillota bacterium]|nr:ABC transporter permease [Bacillota bacterium]